MGHSEEFNRRNREIAQRFLQTAVVVDDEAYMQFEQPHAGLVTPDRYTQASNQEHQSTENLEETTHKLNAGSIMCAFSKLGVICGVIGPANLEMETMRQADIVILDWLLDNGKPQRALEFIRDLLTDKTDRNSLRLMAVYTGEARLMDVAGDVIKELTSAGLGPVTDETGTTITYRHGRVVLYAKSDVKLSGDLKDRCVAEEDLPGKLVNDFASMTSGLLPGIALTSLTAVREGAHKVLDRFNAKLDPAFLAHRACLPVPEDTELQIVYHLAEELRGLMDNLVAEESPAGTPAVENWIRHKHDGKERFKLNGHELDMKQFISLAREGIGAKGSGGKKILTNRQQETAIKHLSACFATQDFADLDQQLAWIMSFRTVYNAPPPTLWLGTVISDCNADDDRHLICMRPRCDCVRLDGETRFFFLPLVKPEKGLCQIIVKIGHNYERREIKLDQGNMVIREFSPPKDSGAVTAEKSENGKFEFEDCCGRRYEWRGELKAEYAYRISQALARNLSRPAIDESEWLRRIARK